LKKAAIWTLLTCFLVISLVLSSCGSSTTTTTTAATSSTTTKTTTTTVSQTTTKTTAVSTSPTTALSGNWWDKLGKPTYGGDLTVSLPQNISSWDDYDGSGFCNINTAYQDDLVSDNWTLNPSIFAYQLSFRSSDYEVGSIGTSWEFTDPNTYTVHLRQGIHYQNLPPVNGREFTSADVAYHWNRLLGLGGGFTSPSPYYSSASSFAPLKSITTPDKYTVNFNFQGISEESICELLQGVGTGYEASEVVQQYGSTRDWHHAIGEGPYIVTDFVSDSSATLAKNPTYWQHDERYPQNQLPYIDQIHILIIPNQATALAGVRTGKIDVLDNVSFQDAQSMKKTNPEILQLTYPSGGTPTVDPRLDVTPFSDIRVRQAMQQAVDLPTIAATYYAGSCPAYPSSCTSMYMSGWDFPYPQWPQDLKDQYAYNPTAAKALLAAAGFPTGFNTNCIANNGQDLDLLQIIQSYFAAVGINMSVKTMDPATWSTYVRAHKQDQLCFGGNSAGFSFPPFSDFNRWRTGYAFSWQNASDPKWDAMRATAIAATTSIADAEKTLVAANEYMARQHWVISSVTPNFFAVYQPWFKGYSGQVFSVSAGGGVGPLYFGFYCSRFWIDTGLKKSMGH